MRNEGKAHEEEETLTPVAEGVRRVALGCSDVSLQEALPTAVMSAAEGFKYDPRAEGERLSTSAVLSTSLPPPHPAATTSSCLICRQQFGVFAVIPGTRGHQDERTPCRNRGADLVNLKQHYPAWITWKRMTKERKSLVFRKLEF